MNKRTLITRRDSPSLIRVINQTVVDIDNHSYDEKSFRLPCILGKKFELIAIEVLSFVHTFKGIIFGSH